MKNIIIIAIGIIAAYMIYSFNNPSVDFKIDTPEGIQFHKGSWQLAIDSAKKTNKLIFLDVYASWCGPCKKLKKNVFSNSEVGLYFNANFINVALDGEENEGLKIATAYKIDSYPTLLFIDKDGNVLKKAEGYHSSKELIQLGKTVYKN